MKNSSNDFNLIEGAFTIAEAKEILMTLFSDKIKFHSLKDFSHTERYGAPDPHAQVRIPELKSTRDEVLNYLADFNEKYKCEIHADIRLNIVPVEVAELSEDANA